MLFFILKMREGKMLLLFLSFVTSLELPVPVPHSGSVAGADSKALPLIHMVQPAASVLPVSQELRYGKLHNGSSRLIKAPCAGKPYNYCASQATRKKTGASNS